MIAKDTKTRGEAASVRNAAALVVSENVAKLIALNRMRNAEIRSKFNPITGEGSIGERKKIEIEDFPFPVQYVPLSMLKVPLVQQLLEAGSIRKFLEDYMNVEYSEEDKEKVIEQFVRLRAKHDFAFWAAMYVFIKQKGGGEDVHFRLNRPQRKLIMRFERRRLQGKPIRLILLKARQWGGSTATQIYMAWLQLVHKVGLNSLIVGHVKDASTEVKDMFDKLIKEYPVSMLYEMGEAYNETEPKIVGVGQSGNIHRIPQRNCKIKVGTAEKPNSARGGDYNLVHCTEVGLWVTTDGKTPEQIVRSACSGILLKPYTMIVYESTANGTGNFFQREYDAAKNNKSQFEALFISWFEIEQYSVPIDNIKAFATKLWENRNNANAASDREESGKYLWWLWEQGATLEAINWYILERSKYTDHGDMASEYPSDDVEAFVHSGARVFDKYNVEKFKKCCKAPKYVGDVYADGDEGEDALCNLRFKEDKQGLLWVWSKPDVDDKEEVTDRYLVVVDIGGRGKKADWSVIVVFDRLNQMEGGKPVVVAQWYGHIDMDMLAWKAAQIAAFYDNALLVIESNTLETHDKERQVDGDMSGYILNQIKDVYSNLYARKQSDEEIQEGEPKKYGFHTNVATKPKIISTLVKVIREQLYVERDLRCLDEYLCYEKKKNGAFGAITGKHDDLLMTRAIGLHISFYEMEVPTIIPRVKRRAVKRKRAISAATI
ncbi:MAG: terminase [Prevotella sp.]|nr:terminase [Prevotella sp.]